VFTSVYQTLKALSRLRQCAGGIDDVALALQDERQYFRDILLVLDQKGCVLRPCDALRDTIRCITLRLRKVPLVNQYPPIRARRSRDHFGAADTVS
jgi:hypothetical protein